MKHLIFLMVLVLNSVALAQNEQALVPMATKAVLEVFEGTTTGALWKLDVTKDQDEVAATILYIDAAKAPRTAGFDCHFHDHAGAVEAHCHDISDEPASIATPGHLDFSLVQIQQSLDYVVDVFARKVASASQITGLTLWQNGHEIYASLKYDNATGATAANFMCHQHDAEHLDCHRVRSLPAF